MDATTSVVWVTDASALIVDPQPKWEAYTGQQWPEYSGSGFMQAIHPEDRAESLAHIGPALVSHEPQHLFLRIWHHPSQSWHHTETMAVPVKTDDGRVLEWVGTTTDVEDRYQRLALEHLRARDERLLLAEAAARMGTWEWDLNRTVLWSEGFSRILGVAHLGADRRETLNQLFARVHRDDRQRVISAFEEARDSGQGINIEFRTGDDNDTVRWVYSRGSYLPATESARARMVGITLDITEQVSTRQALADALTASGDALALVDAVISATPTAVALLDSEMRYIRINAAAAAINNLPIEAHIGRRLEEVLPDIGPPLANVYREVWRNGRSMPPSEVSNGRMTADGVRRWAEHSAAPVRDIAGNIVALVVMFTDITARKHADEALRRAEQRERFMSQATRELIGPLQEGDLLLKVAQLAASGFADGCTLVLFDHPSVTPMITAGDPTDEEQQAMSHVRFRNWYLEPGGERMSEALMRGEAVFLPTEEAIAQRAPSEEQRALVQQLGLRSLICQPLLRRGITIGVAMFAMRRSGRAFDEADVAVARDLAERVAVVLENTRLVGELRDTAEDLRRANAAKDDFLSMVSHELRTPLTTVMGNALALQNHWGRLDDASRMQALQDISEEGERFSRLIDNMLALARLEGGYRLEAEPLLLRRVAEKVVEVYSLRNPRRHIRVSADTSSTIVLGAPEYLEHVVMNLVSNADKYSPEGAPVEIRVRRQKDEVCLDVLDRGPGVPAEELNVIFQPFYRSKETAGRAPGIGVGLALCKRAIEAQHGRLWARRRRGGGSDFGFALPVLEDENASTNESAQLR